jgi:hypothetical protein
MAMRYMIEASVSATTLQSQRRDFMKNADEIRRRSDAT